MALDVYTAETVRNCISYMSDEKIAAYVRCDLADVRRVRHRYLPTSEERARKAVKASEPKVSQIWPAWRVQAVLARRGHTDIRFIAKEFGVSVNAIRGIFRRHGGSK